MIPIVPGFTKPPDVLCSICSEGVGHLFRHKCSMCGRILCINHTITKGSFFGFGGNEYCPYCAKKV